MLDSNSILQLYENVLNKDMDLNRISLQDIKRGVQNMARVYAPEPTRLRMNSINTANYNDVAQRCAYLYKYAAFHTAMVQDVMIKILEQQWKLFRTITSSDNFRICSLGGGPGNDVIGIIAALNTLYSAFKVQVTVVDLMEHWKYTFSSIIDELNYGNYGTIQTNVADKILQWDYIGANLLDKMTNPVERAVSDASLITLIKFVSAAACKDTENMVERIFEAMKPGALLLFIDNAAGGFRELIERTRYKCKCVTVFGPIHHHKYSNESLKIVRFGYTSCFKTTVTVHLLQKPFTQQSRKLYDNISFSSDQENGSTFSDVIFISETINDKKLDHSRNSSHSHSNTPLFQKANLTAYVNDAFTPVPSEQENDNMLSNVTPIPEPAKKISAHSNLSFSHINNRLFENSYLPGFVNKALIPVSFNQQGAEDSSNVPLVEEFDKENTNPQSNLHSTRNNTGLFQNINSPVHSPMSQNKTSTSHSIHKQNKPFHSSKIIPVKSVNLPSNHKQINDNTIVDESNNDISLEEQSNARSNTARPTNSNRTSSTILQRSPSNNSQLEDNSFSCFSCCVIS